MKSDNTGSGANEIEGIHHLPAGIDKRRTEAETAHSKHRIIQDTSDIFVYN